MKNKILSAIALAIASITTQAAIPVDGLEYYVAASLGWHALSNKKTAVSPVSVTLLPESIATNSNVGAVLKKAVLDDKRQMDFAGFIGARQFFDQGFFVGFEGRVSKTRKEFTTSATAQAQTAPFKEPADKSLAKNSHYTTPFREPDTIGLDYINQVIYQNHFKNSYSVSANVPVGMRFDIDNDISIDVYGILGYQYSKYKVSNNIATIAKRETNKTPFKASATEGGDFNLSGFQYGVGFDINVQEFKIGARYVINHLSTKDAYLKDTNLLSKDTKDNTFSVNLSYVF